MKCVFRTNCTRTRAVGFNLAPRNQTLVAVAPVQFVPGMRLFVPAERCPIVKTLKPINLVNIGQGHSTDRRRIIRLAAPTRQHRPDPSYAPTPSRIPDSPMLPCISSYRSVLCSYA
eukprot:936508-Rhodomonas_salina.2